MTKRIIVVVTITIIILVAGSYFLFFNFGDSREISKVEQQLWTCGMHPQILVDEPGNCPICGMRLEKKRGNNSANQISGERKILYWRAPMDPNETYDSPGKSKMGMDLVPVYEDQPGGAEYVSIDPTVVQNMNVKTEKVTRKKLSNVVETNGVLSARETDDFIVTTRVNGWVEKLYINYTGQKVLKGQKLMDIYSPELVAAQQELISAMLFQKATSGTDLQDVLKSGNELIKNSVRKLQLLEMSEKDIADLQNTKEVKTFVTLYAGQSGTVVSKNVVEGQKVMPGMSLLQITDFSTLWLTADIYEYELSKVQEGSLAEIKFNFMPGTVTKGRVSFIYPTIDPKTRTTKARIDVPNPKGVLKPAMLANVLIWGKDMGENLVVPENAVIRSGKKDIVVVALDKGKFQPREILLGEYSDDHYQVLSGLNEGENIVTSAQFLIDSESNLKAAVSQFSKVHNHETSSSVEGSAKIKDIDNGTSSKSGKDASNTGESIIHEGLIDLKVIDKDKNGKVYQDPMDWNVISDVPGRCPLCEMKLVEVSLEDAKRNLIEHGFDVK